MTDADRKTLARIAEQQLDIDTLELRGAEDLDFYECDVSSIEAALREAFEAGQRSQQFEPTALVLKRLRWLASNDRNGLWSEYLENFAEASHEHGELDEDELEEIIEEMKE